MKSLLLILTSLFVIVTYSREDICYFRYSNSNNPIEQYEDSNVPLYLRFNLSENLNDYDGVRIKIFGSKRKSSRSESLYKTHDLSIDFLQKKNVKDDLYELVVLQNKGQNIWLSEIGLERLRFRRYRRIRIEVHLLKEKGITDRNNSSGTTVSYFEHQINASKWLSVKEVRGITKPKKKRAVLPIVAFSAIGGFSLLALASR